MLKNLKNGFIVQNIKEFYMGYENYNGIAKYTSWPLQKIRGEDEEKITSNLEKKLYFKDGIVAITKIEMLNDYLSLCSKNNIYVRILFIESENCNLNSLENYKNNIFLGWDLVLTGLDFYSAICDEYDLIKKHGLSKNINSNGLFYDEKKLKEYIKIREQYNNNEIEVDEDFIIIKVYEVFEK